jgi:hypothetical protein
MKAVRRDVGIFDVNAQEIAGPRINDGSRHAMVIGGLINVRDDNLVGLGNKVRRIEILAIYKRMQTACRYLVRRYRAILVINVSHAIALVLNRGRNMRVRSDRAIITKLLNF